MELGVSSTYVRNFNSTKKITVNQGGARSGKTYSILQLIVFHWCKQYTGLVITIARKELSSLKVTAMRDFFDILNGAGLYNPRHWNKSNFIYMLNGNTIEFVGMDKADKKRGAKRDILFMNEATEFKLEDWRQFIIRSGSNILPQTKVYIDYNPSEEFHWIYDEILPRDDVDYIQSTYFDNWAFLPQDLKDEIERYRIHDPEFYKVFGMGDRAAKSERIFTSYSYFEGWGDNVITQKFASDLDICYGLDIGTTHPSALVMVGITPEANFLEQKMYEAGLSSIQLIDRVIKEVKRTPNRPIFVETATGGTGIIKDLRDAGLHAFEANKGQGSVADGIRYMKSKEMYLHTQSKDLIEEVKYYSWDKRKINGTEYLDEKPIKVKDDALDAARYAIWSRHKQVGNAGKRYKIF